MFLDDLINFTRIAKLKGVYPNIRQIEGPSSGNYVNINGRKMLSFSSNNYIGLARDKRVISAGISALKKYGVGPTSARLMSGNLDIYEKLEEATANYIGTESCVVFSSGYMANIGTISALAKFPYQKLFPRIKKVQSILIISDEKNHASIIDGCRLSGADKAIFKHNDVEDLERILKENKSRQKFIIVDGVYSMDGDIAPLDKIVALKKKYGCALMIDDAHATGILGKTGRGTFEYFGIKPVDIDIIMSTFVKAFGTVGGFICCSKGLADYVKVAARPFVFSICVAPDSAAATMKSIEIMESDPTRRVRVNENALYLRNKLNEMGFSTGNSMTQIIPVIIGDENKCSKLEEALFNEGVLAPAVVYPAVDRGQSRIRISITSNHTRQDMGKLLSIIEQKAKELGILK